MKYTPKQYAEVLYDLVKKAPSTDIKNLVKNFVDTLVKNGDVSKAKMIVSEFEKIYFSEKGERRVEVTTVGGEATLLKNKLKGEVVFREDAGVLGGVRIKIGDKLVDNTLRARIDALKESLEV